ncbi:MAG: hypothetical protein AABO58_25280 [Acidobacteriota bacterium]
MHYGRVNGPPRKIALGGAGFYADPRWSPDGKMISFTDNSRTLLILHALERLGQPERVLIRVIFGNDHS